MASVDYWNRRSIPSLISHRCERSTSKNRIDVKSIESMCISSYCEEVGVDQTNDVVVYLPRIFEGILATMSRIPQSAFIWPLESLAILISVDENFVSTIESRLSPLAIELFVNYVQDPLINGETTA